MTDNWQTTTERSVRALAALGYQVTHFQGLSAECLIEATGAGESYHGRGSTPDRALAAALGAALASPLARACWLRTVQSLGSPRADANSDCELAPAVGPEPQVSAAVMLACDDAAATMATPGGASLERRSLRPRVKTAVPGDRASTAVPGDASSTAVPSGGDPTAVPGGGASTTVPGGDASTAVPGGDASAIGSGDEATRTADGAAAQTEATAEGGADRQDQRDVRAASIDGIASDPSVVGCAAGEPEDMGPPIAPWRTLSTMLEFREFIQDTADTIQQSRATLYGLAPRILLIQLAVWLSRVRAVQTVVGTEDAFELANGQIIHRLQAIVKELWPGNLSALRWNALPEELVDLLGDHPRDWTEAADLAELRLEEGEGLVDWADGPEAHAPSQPDLLVEEVRATLDRRFGPDAYPDHAVWRQELRHVPRDPEILRELTTAAQRLRWARPFVDDTVAWGAQIGRLRWLQDRLRLVPTTSLSAALDPSRLPPRGWARELGLDPRTLERRRQRAELRRALPLHNGDVDALAAWFADAAAVFEAPELVPMLAPYHSVFMEISPSVRYNGRALGTVRNRYATVRKNLHKSDLDNSPGVALALAEDEVDLGATAAVALGAQLEGEAIEAARARVQGLRALVVGNRADPALEEALTERFGLLDADFCDGNKKRLLANACERVRSGSIDIILLVTGFIGHTVEQMVRKAAKGSKIPIVRADKGRPGQMARAILRDLGAT